MRGVNLRAGAARAIVAIAPLVVTIGIVSSAATEASSAPSATAAAALDAALDAARDGGDAGRDAASLDGGPDALEAGRPDALDAARPDALVDALADGADGGRLDAPPREGGWFPDAPRPIAPDPTPLLSDSVFVMTVTFTKGAISIDKVEREKLPSKQAVVRRFGRFAAELYSGPTLLERVRFDFPLIADDDYAGDVYARGLTTSVKVRIPESDRPNKLEIWDRATERRWSFDYPPKAP